MCSRCPDLPAGFTGPTFKQLGGRTIPATEAFWNRYNYRRDYHYFIGRQAPKFMNFAQPIIKPLDWEHCIHWYNGTIVHMPSHMMRRMNICEERGRERILLL